MTLPAHLVSFPYCFPDTHISFRTTEILSAQEITDILTSIDPPSLDLKLNEFGRQAIACRFATHPLVSEIERISPLFLQHNLSANLDLESDHSIMDAKKPKKRDAKSKYKKSSEQHTSVELKILSPHQDLQELASDAGGDAALHEMMNTFSNLVSQVETLAESGSRIKAISALESEVGKLRASGATSKFASELLTNSVKILSKCISHPAKMTSIKEIANEEITNSMHNLDRDGTYEFNARTGVVLIQILAECKQDAFSEDALKIVLDALHRYFNDVIVPSLANTEAEMEKQPGRPQRQTQHKGRMELERRCALLITALSEATEITRRLPLQDRELLSMTQLCLGPLFLEGADVPALLHCCINILQIIFGRYPAHRHSVMEEIFARLGSWRPSVHANRCYLLSNSKTIQWLSVLILHLMQAAIAVSEIFEQNEFPEGAPENHVHIGINHAKQFLFSILEKTRVRLASADKMTFRRSEKDQLFGYSSFLKRLCEDICSTLALAEWPVSALAWRVLWKKFFDMASSDTFPTVHRQLAVDLFCTLTENLLEMANTTSAHLICNKKLKEYVPELAEQHRQLHLRFPSELDLPLDRGDSELRRAVSVKQLLLNFLTRAVKSDEYVSFARRVHIADWISSAMEGKREKTKVPCEACSTVRIFEAQWDLPSDWVAFGRFPIPSNIDAASISFEIASKCTNLAPLLKDRKNLLLPVLKLLQNQRQSGFRQRALKALASIAAYEPWILELEPVSRHVSASMHDSARSVRAAAVSLVGGYMCRSTNLTERYYKDVCKLCQDEGASVRKEAVTILRECLVLSSTPQIIAEAACIAIVPLLRDESQVIRNRTESVLRDLWFPPPLSEDANDDDDTDEIDENSLLSRRFNQISAVLARDGPVCGVRDGATHTDLLLRLILEILGEPSSRLSAHSRKLCGKYCRHGVQQVIRVHEGSLVRPDSDFRLSPETNLLRFFRTLALFGRASPELLIRDAPVLHQYLAVPENSSTDAAGRDRLQLSAKVAEIYDYMLPHMHSMPAGLGAYLRKDLSDLIMKAPRTELLAASVRCLGTLARTASAELTATVTVITRLLNSNLGVIQSKAPSVSQLCRSLMVTGLICRHNYTVQDHTRLVGDDQLQMILDLAASKYANHEDHPVRVAAQHCLGSLFALKPSFLLQPHALASVSSALGPSEHESVSLEAVRAIGEFAGGNWRRNEEITAENDSADEFEKSHPRGDKAMDDACARNAGMQRLLQPLLMCLSRRGEALALEASHLIGKAHDRGQVHPKLFLPGMLSCLQRKPACRAAASRVIAAVTEKHSEYFTPEVFLEDAFSTVNRGNFAARLAKLVCDRLCRTNPKSREVCLESTSGAVKWPMVCESISRAQYVLSIVLSLPYSSPLPLQELAAKALAFAVGEGSMCVAELQCLLEADPAKRPNMMQDAEVVACAEVASLVMIFLDARRLAVCAAAAIAGGRSAAARREEDESAARFPKPLTEELATFAAQGVDEEVLWATLAKGADQLEAKLRAEVKEDKISDESGGEDAGHGARAAGSGRKSLLSNAGTARMAGRKRKAAVAPRESDDDVIEVFSDPEPPPPPSESAGHSVASGGQSVRRSTRARLDMGGSGSRKSVSKNLAMLLNSSGESSADSDSDWQEG